MEILNNNEILTVVSQLLFATFLGVILGVERTIAHKNAGMRTYGLISLGAALFVVIAKEAVQMYPESFGTEFFKIPSQVVVGIGFIGGGLIMVHGNTVRGITTAAGLWVTAGIGMAVGFELYTIAVIVTIITLFVFTLLWRFEDKIKIFANTKNHECMIDELGKVVCKDEDR